MKSPADLAHNNVNVLSTVVKMVVHLMLHHFYPSKGF